MVFLNAKNEDMLLCAADPYKASAWFGGNWCPTDVTDEDTKTWTGISQGGAWMFVKWGMIQKRSACIMPTNAVKELRILAELHGHGVDSNVYAVADALVSTDQCTIKGRAPKCDVKPSRVAQFTRKFPHMWQEAVHAAEAKQTIQRWLTHRRPGHGGMAGRAINQALHWMQQRVKGGLRVCHMQVVGNMPLLFRKQVYYRISQLPLEQIPLRPDPAFCDTRNLKGVFVALDFEMPQVPYLQCPMHLTLRYHGTSLYGLSSALATGFLAGTSGRPVACVQST